MQNAEGKIVDAYIPRKCSASNRIIGAQDHAAIQLNIGQVDAAGVYTGSYTTFAFSGYVRSNAFSDQALNRLAAEKKLIKDLQKDFVTQDKYPRARE